MLRNLLTTKKLKFTKNYIQLKSFRIEKERDSNNQHTSNRVASSSLYSYYKLNVTKMICWDAAFLICIASDEGLYTRIRPNQNPFAYTQYRNIRNGGVFPVLGLFLKFSISSLLGFLSFTKSFLKIFKIFTLVS